MHFVLFAGVIILLLAYASRAATLFVVEVQNGALKVSRGKPPTRLVNDFREAVRHVKQGTIKGRKTSRGVQLSFSGQIDEGTQQRLRNILGVHQS